MFPFCLFILLQNKTILCSCLCEFFLSFSPPYNILFIIQRLPLFANVLHGKLHIYRKLFILLYMWFFLLPLNDTLKKIKIKKNCFFSLSVLLGRFIIEGTKATVQGSGKIRFTNFCVYVCHSYVHVWLLKLHKLVSWTRKKRNHFVEKLTSSYSLKINFLCMKFNSHDMVGEGILLGILHKFHLNTKNCSFFRHNGNVILTVFCRFFYTASAFFSLWIFCCV